MSFIDIIKNLGEFDPGLLFALSIVPYSFFLFFLHRSRIFNKEIFIGFSFTIVFVVATIFFNILAERNFGKSLVEVDLYHGLAESFLTLSDLIILYGFIKLLNNKEMKKFKDS